MPSSSRLLFWLGLVMTTTMAAILTIGPLTWTLSQHDAVPPGHPLRVGYALKAPYAFRDEAGRLHGESIDLMRTAMHQLGYPEPVWVHVEFAALIHELEMGRIDAIASGLFITPERARRVDFSRPSAAVPLGLLVAPGNPLNLHSLADLMSVSPARLGVLAQSVEQDTARQAGLPPPRLLHLRDTEQGLDALRRGHAQALLLSAPSMHWLIAQARAAASPHPMHLPEPAEPFWMPTELQDRSLGHPALAFRRGDPLRDEVDRVLADYIGSAAHRRQVRPYGFDARQIDPVRGAHWPPAPAGGHATVEGLTP